MPALLRSFAAVSLIAMGSVAQAASYQIPDNIGYKDVTIIPSNIVEECKELGRQLSGSLAAELTKTGAEVHRVATLDAAAGPVIDIKISNMVSAGNAFIGHRKSASVWVELRQGSEVLGAKGFTRDTMGGAFAGFKGSCTVLERAVLVLGKDVAQWTQSIPLRTGTTVPAAAASAP
jgi:hypothetical protein